MHKCWNWTVSKQFLFHNNFSLSYSGLLFRLLEKLWPKMFLLKCPISWCLTSEWGIWPPSILLFLKNRGRCSQNQRTTKFRGKVLFFFFLYYAMKIIHGTVAFFSLQFLLTLSALSLNLYFSNYFFYPNVSDLTVISLSSGFKIYKWTIVPSFFCSYKIALCMLNHS